MIDVKQTLAAAEERVEMAAMYLEEELNRVRAGRANVAILDGVRVESYGSRVPLNKLPTFRPLMRVPLLLSLGTRSRFATSRRPSWTAM